MLQIVDPDVPAADDSGEEPLVVEALLVRDELDVVPAAVLVGGAAVPVGVPDQIEAHPLDRRSRRTPYASPTWSK